MTTQIQNSQTQSSGISGQQQETKPSDKEMNFRALENRLRNEQLEKQELQRQLQLAQQQARPVQQEEEDDNEPYVDRKKLNKTLSRFGEATQGEIQKAMEIAKQSAKEELKQEMWLENNPDFYDTLKHAEKFAQRAPKLAETILRMPEGFERQKLVYQNIKELGIDKPEQKQSSIQDKIDANQRSPYYQPSGVGTAPYASVGDYSKQGQKQAYEKMQQLKSKYGM